MNKAFVRESDDEEEEIAEPQAAVTGERNYITPQGHARLKSELLQLLDQERPEVVRVVSWAASNGDRSENGDYLYGKKRLREIDRRIRFLTRRLDKAEVVDPLNQVGNDQIFFGATVSYLQSDGIERTVRIVGVDEVDPLRGLISWISPVARALIKAREGDTVALNTPSGPLELEVLSVRYESGSEP
ncbi:MAG: transcription elongation factor GreB [Burkholderiaceae bacterium]